jgi:hypothetical protein
MDSGTLIIGLFAGAIGLGYFVYGKKQAQAVPMISGIALMVYPYFFSNIWVLLGLGLALCLAPFYIKF